MAFSRRRFYLPGLGKTRETVCMFIASEWIAQNRLPGSRKIVPNNNKKLRATLPHGQALFPAGRIPGRIPAFVQERGSS